MNNNIIASCGINCTVCYAYQRTKNKCSGCNSKEDTNKPNHCKKCSIKYCTSKQINELCNSCTNFPCSRLKQLDKRYKLKYRQSLIDNLNTINEIGINDFIKQDNKKWQCPECKNLLSTHKDNCLYCGALNEVRYDN